MKSELYSVESGSAVGSVDLPRHVFGNALNDHVIYDAIKAELANQRQGTASTRERAEIHGSGSKPYRQKGTGRARAGTRKSPLWTGGGTVFGPSPRDFHIRLPRKMRMRAMVSLLSRKADQGQIRIIEDFKFESGKTKDMAALLSKVCDRDRVVLIIKDNPQLIKRAARNIPWVKCYSSSRLVYKDLFYARMVLITRGALADLEERYAVEVKKGAKDKT